MKKTTRRVLLEAIETLRPETFEETALAIFKYQAANNALYAKFLRLLRRDAASVRCLAEVPFLPIQFFKNHKIQSGRWQAKSVFTSSGTTGQKASQHLVRNPDFYLKNTAQGFAHFYGNPTDWCFLALLPAYLERSGSSLVAMADFFIKRSRYPESGFFLHDFGRLHDTILICLEKRRPTLLLGVSFALLDFAEQIGPLDLRGITVMETGGMKGRRRELTRPELHETLQTAFHLPEIHSEYGMTELFSQAYATGGSIFRPAPTLRALTADIYDPFAAPNPGKNGTLNLVDLANLDTCSFIATEDVGRVYEDGSFEVLGRLDAAEMRGCNLMIE